MLELNMQNRQLYEEETNISDMCKKFNVTPRTLRFYESKELLFPIRIAQKRLFTRRDQARLKLILQGKRFGFSLEDIRQLLNLYDIGDQQTTQLARTYKLAAQRLIIMESQRDELTLAIDDLKNMLKIGKQELSVKGISV
jgi:DNA-binding transcriptional MerR regulator